jgi:hypothetical protein
MEKRRHKRHKKRIEVHFKGGDDSVARGFARDISEQGLFIRSRKLMPPGTQIDITASLPEGVSGQMRGIVRRNVKGLQSTSHNLNGMGVEMLAYDMAFSHYLRTVVGDLTGPDLSMYSNTLGSPIVVEKKEEEQQAARPSVLPERKTEAESVVVACISCGTKNRVPRAKFSSMPKCANCQMFLIVSG